VKGELNLAFTEKKIIIPYRIDETPLKGAMRLILNQTHWVDAYPDAESKFGELVEAAERFLGRPAVGAFRTEPVVPLTMKKACAAPKACAASTSASWMTDTGWQRLSSGFMELTSASIVACPRNSVSSGFPFPCLWPGTSNGTTRSLEKARKASKIGARA